MQLSREDTAIVFIDPQNHNHLIVRYKHSILECYSIAKCS
jgi:hypothetical protein